MSPTGKEAFFTLREIYRRSEYRRFRAKHRSNRWAEFLGFGPSGETVIGWWEGSEDEQHFEPDERQWCKPTTYV